MTLSVAVLAAGKGTRMRNDRPKVLHDLAGRSLIGHVLGLASALDPARVVTVLAPGMDLVAAEARRHVPEGEIAIQDPPRGTGHALAAALPALPREGTVLVLYGDTPLLTRATLEGLLARRAEAGAAVAVLGMRPPDPSGYGRLRFDQEGDLVELVEHAHASEELRRAGVCNSGVMAFDGERLPALLEAMPYRADKGEYYLTDVIAAANERGWRCVAVEGPWQEGHGVNSQAQLAEAMRLLQDRRRSELLEAGVVMPAPETVYLAADTAIAPGAVVEPYVVFGAGVTVARAAHILSHSHIEGAEIGEGARVGPFARLRPGTRIGRAAHIGNFVEAKNAALEAGAKANHLTYLGDCEIGAQANVGAGTITCNYDGFAKHRTAIGEAAFIGSNTALVAPVTVGAGAIIGAGSVITRDVPEESVSVARARQEDRPGRAAALRQRHRERKARMTGEPRRTDET